MPTFEITASNVELDFTLYWTRGWARAREKYYGRLQSAQLGQSLDAAYASRAETRLERAKKRFGRGMRRNG